MKIFSNEKTNLLFLISIVIVIVILPFFTNGFASGDEVEFYITMKMGDFFNNASIYAKDTGRFYLYFSKPLYSLIYAFDSIPFTRIANTLLLVSNYIFAALIVAKITKSEWLFFLFVLIGITTVPIMNCSPVVSYPVYFTLSFLIIECSILLYIVKYKSSTYRWLAALVFLLGLLLYEVYFVYIFIIALLVFIVEYRSNNNFKGAIKDFFKKFMPFIVVVTIYLIAYLTFRHFHPAKYDGSSIANNLNVSKVFNCMIAYGKGAIPLYSLGQFQSIISQKSMVPVEHANQLIQFFSRSKAEWFVMMIFTFIIAFKLLQKLSEIRIKDVFYLMAFGILLFFLPQLPISITPKYLMYADWGLWAYITSYFSHFGVVLFLISIFLLLIYLFANKIYVSTLIIFFSTAISFIALENSYCAYYIFKDQRQNHRRFQMIDYFLETAVFKKLPENAYVYCPDLWKSQSISNSGVTEQNHSWEMYFRVKTGKNLIMERTLDKVSTLDFSKDSVYYIYYNQSFKSDDQVLLVAKILPGTRLDSNEQKIISNKADVFYFSPYRKFSIFIIGDEEMKNVCVNDSCYNITGNNMWLNINYPDQQSIPFFHIKAKGMIVNSFMISNLEKTGEPTLTIKTR
jgi:hypothetical protein